MKLTWWRICLQCRRPQFHSWVRKIQRRSIGYQYSWAFLVAQLVKICLQCGRSGFHPWVGKIPWRRERLPTPVFYPGEFYVHRVTKSRIQLSDFHFHFPWNCLGTGQNRKLEVKQTLMIKDQTVQRLFSWNFSLMWNYWLQFPCPIFFLVCDKFKQSWFMFLASKEA